MFQASEVVCCIQLIPTISMQFCEIQASLGGGIGLSLVSHPALCSPPNPIYICWGLKCTLKAIFYGPPFSQQGFYQNWLELEFPSPQATLTRPFPFSHSCATDATTPNALQISSVHNPYHWPSLSSLPSHVLLSSYDRVRSSCDEILRSWNSRLMTLPYTHPHTHTLLTTN